MAEKRKAMHVHERKSQAGAILSWRRLLGLCCLLLGLLLSSLTRIAAQPTTGPIFIVQIQNEIDLGLAPYLSRVIAEAKEQQAAALILEINTPGGRLDAALQMRDALLSAETPTVAFVNREAFSAGALIAIAAERIYMAPGSVMGAATPVDASGAAGDEKVISAVRSTFRSTAELRGRDPLLAEAMVDPAVTVAGLVDNDQLLTLTTVQAREHGYADGVAASRQELLAQLGFAAAPVVETAPGLAENVVRFLTSPVVASLLTSLGMLLIMADIYTTGFGALGLTGLGLLGLFFWGHMLAGLAGWEGVALVVVGLLLIVVEVFLLPGFGIAGILGGLGLIAGLFLSLVEGTIVTSADLLRAGLTIGATFVLVLTGSVFVLRFLTRSGRLRGLVLQAQLASTQEGAASAGSGAPATGRHSELLPGPLERPASQRTLAGLRGRALSDLHPGGVAEIEGRRVDVVSQGDYIRAGELVEIIIDEGYRRVVRRLHTTNDEQQPTPAAPGD